MNGSRQSDGSVRYSSGDQTMSRDAYSCACGLRLPLAMLMLILVVGKAQGAQETINGTPLQIAIADDQSAQVSRYEIDASNPTPAFSRQYYSSYYPFLVMTPPTPVGAASASPPATWSGELGNFTAVSNTISADGYTIVTVDTVDSGNVTIQQTVTYVQGAQQYQHTWVVTNTTTGNTYTNVALRYGGDTYFADSDSASGFWDPTLGFVYCTDPNVSGLMGMYGGSGTPATNYYEDGFGNVWSALENAASPLPNTVNANFIDNGMGLEWIEGTLAPGGSFTVTAIEEWTAAGAVQVLPPPAQNISAGVQASLQFTVQNLETNPDTFSLSVATTGGVTANVEQSVQIPAQSSVIVSVSVSTAQLSGSTATVTLTATSGSISNQGVATLNAVAALGTVVVTGPEGQTNYNTGGTVAVSFTILSQESYPASDTFNITTVTSQGFLAGRIAPVVIAAGSSTNVSVPVTALAAAGTSGTLQLIATSASTPSITSQATASLVANPVNVVVPAVQHAGLGSTVTIPFTVQNNLGVGATFTFTVTAPSGMSAVTPASVTIPANSSVIVDVVVTVTSVVAGTPNLVTLSATAFQQTAQASTIIVLTQPVAVPPLPISQGTQTVYNSICPSTPEGVLNILTVMAPESSSTAQAYAWDSASQNYVLLPAQPAAGLLPSSGVFIATRHPLGLDFAGTPSASPIYLSLLPGWNFIGIPLLIDNTGTLITSHNFPGDFTLYDSGSSEITDITTFANDLGTVGSGSAATAQPFFYDGTAYSQQAVLTVGLGYWIKNNTTGTLTLGRNQTGVTTTLSRLAPAKSGGKPANATSNGSPGVLIDRGTPPPPPSTASSSASDSGGHGCGLGTGAAAIAILSLFLFARRLRV
jgi:hypothetical protein